MDSFLFQSFSSPTVRLASGAFAFQLTASVISCNEKLVKINAAISCTNDLVRVDW